MLTPVQLYNGIDMSPCDKIIIADVFIFDRDIKYDLRSTDNWGPVISPEPILRLRKKYGLPIPDWIIDWKNHIRSNEDAKNNLQDIT